MPMRVPYAAAIAVLGCREGVSVGAVPMLPVHPMSSVNLLPPVKMIAAHICRFAGVRAWVMLDGR